MVLYIPRRAGLSRNQKVPPLHDLGKGKKANTVLEDDPDAPPMPSSDEESDVEVGSASCRGAITPSLFGPPHNVSGNNGRRGNAADSGVAVNKERPRRSPGRSSARISSAQFKKQPNSTTEDISEDESNVSAGSKRARTKSDVEGSPFGSQHHLVARKSAKTYGAKSNMIRVPRKRTGGLPVTGKAALSSRETTPVRFIAPMLDDDSKTPDTPGNHAKFIAPGSVFSPTSEHSPKATFRASAVTDTPSKPHATFKAVDLQSGDGKQLAALQNESQSMGRARAISLSSLSSLSDLDSPLSNELALCPMCDAPIDADLLQGLSASTMSIAQQQRVCRLHKRRDADAIWKEKGYPDIDWDGLGERFERQHGYLKKVLETDVPSYYRDEYSKKVESGKGRTLLTSEGPRGGGASLTPGYYGLRGARLMSEWLIGRFSAPLRRRAVKDRLVAARGHTTYVLSVLVPELAARLIAEDMSVGPEAAREVLRDSARLGELVHEEIGDVVCDDEDEGDEGEGAY